MKTTKQLEKELSELNHEFGVEHRMHLRCKLPDRVELHFAGETP